MAECLINAPLPCLDTAECESPLKTEVKSETDYEQLHGVKEESSVVKVPVKMERESKASVVGCKCLPPYDCDACVLKCEKTEASSAVASGEEREGYFYFNNVPYVPFELPKTEMKEEPNLEEPAVGGAAGWCELKIEEGGDSCGGERGRGEVEREGVVQPQCCGDTGVERMDGEDVQGEGGVPCGETGVERMDGEDVQGEGGVPCGETGVERMDGEDVQGEGGVPVQATPESSVDTGVGMSVCGDQLSGGSSGPVAHCSTHQERSPPRQQPRRMKARVQNAGGCALRKTSAVSRGHSNVRENSGSVKEHRCPHCPYKAGLKSTLQRHINTVHKGIKKYACHICPYKAGQNFQLQAHIKSVHEGIKKYACPHCPYRASQKTNLQPHIDTVHKGLKKFACPHCGHKFGHNGDMKRHIDTVHNHVKKFACTHCQYRASRRSHLKMHVETVHECLKKFACPHCHYRAGQRSHLNRHVKTFHKG